MRIILTLILLLWFVARLDAQQVIAKDSVGLIVEVKEKYGGLIFDTCTVIMLFDNQFVLVHREGSTGWYPTSFHSIRLLGRIEKLPMNAAVHKPLQSYQIPKD